MSVLSGFPLISQQTPITGDGKPSEDYQQECVPTSILAGMMYLLGITQMNAQWNPDVLKDFAYRDGYKGPTSADHYVPFCAQHGILLSPINGAPAELVPQIHHHLGLGHPVVLTIPDPYVPASYGWTHVLVAYADGAGYITCLDPWPGKPVTKDDIEWQALLRFNQIWILEKIDDMAIDIHSPDVSNYFEEQADGSWLCHQTGKTIHGDILKYYKANSGLKIAGLPNTGEIAVENVNPLFQKYAGKGKRIQYFERAALVFDPDHEIDNPPGSGTVYPAHLYSTNAIGTDPRLWTMQGQISQLTTQLQAEHAGIDPTKVQTRLAQIALEAEQIAATAKAAL